MKHRQDNSREAGRPGGSAAHAPGQRRPVPAVSMPRKWVFRLAAMVIIPLFLAVVLEFALRVAGYGFPTGFFKPQRIGQEDCLVENDKFGLRFFPPEVARSPSPVVMKAQKALGGCRIFILGESAALGDPRPAYGAGRYLGALLQERFPRGRFEVVCVAMTAIDSHAIREIARECAGHQGDLWILYLGNNEMIGPFGAAGVMGAQSPPLSAVRLNLAVQKTRVGQLLLSVARRLRKTPAKGTWAGMEMWVRNRVPPGDPRREVVYGNFRRNLEAMLTNARQAPGNVKVIMSTMAVNLRDCPPLATESTTNLPAAQRARLEELEREAASALAATNAARAAAAFAQAVTIDPQRADLEYRLAESLLLSGDRAGARTHFERARDLDALPFRADSRLNHEIEQAAQKYAGKDLAFFDAQCLLSTNTAEGIAGRDIFYEHVHLNFDGNYLLARAWAERAERLLPGSLTGGEVKPWPDQATCERRLGLTDWNRAGVIEDLLRRFDHPPLSTQGNNASRVAAYRAKLNELRRAMTREGALSARELYTEALARAPQDFRLHENFAEHLEAVGDLRHASAEWRQVTELLPHHHLGYFQSGRLLARQGELPAAEAALAQAVRLRPDLSEGWLERGLVALGGNKFEQSLQFFAKATALQPGDSRVHYYTGRALGKLNRRAEAIEQLRQAVKLNPNYWEALYSLGEELAFDGQETEATARFREVVKLKPDHALAHLNLGVALVKAGRLKEAAREFEETLRTDPKNQLARDYLQGVKSGTGK